MGKAAYTAALVDSTFALSRRDSVHTDLRDGLLCVVSTDEAARLDLADDLEVGALRERGRAFDRPAIIPRVLLNRVRRGLLLAAQPASRLCSGEVPDKFHPPQNLEGVK